MSTPARRLNPDDLARARRYATRPDLAHTAAEWINALVDHAQAYTAPPGTTVPEEVVTPGQWIGEIRDILDEAEAAGLAAAEGRGTDCAQCGHRAWAHGDQNDPARTGDPCHAALYDGGECLCPGGYRS